MLNEIQILKRVNHPNIIKLKEVYEGENHIYLVMEYFEGGIELHDYIAHIKKIPSEDETRKIMFQILSALDYLHDLKIMHRDIKLENILINQNTLDIKIIDFGLAEYICKKELIFIKCGSPGYVAPEILNELKYNYAVDVFSAGIIFYIL